MLWFHSCSIPFVRFWYFFIFIYVSLLSDCMHVMCIHLDFQSNRKGSFKMSFKYAAYYNTFIYADEKRKKSPHTHYDTVDKIIKNTTTQSWGSGTKNHDPNIQIPKRNHIHRVCECEYVHEVWARTIWCRRMQREKMMEEWAKEIEWMYETGKRNIVLVRIKGTFICLCVWMRGWGDEEIKRGKSGNGE